MTEALRWAWSVDEPSRPCEDFATCPHASCASNGITEPGPTQTQEGCVTHVPEHLQLLILIPTAAGKAAPTRLITETIRPTDEQKSTKTNHTRHRRHSRSRSALTRQAKQREFGWLERSGEIEKLGEFEKLIFSQLPPDSCPCEEATTQHNQPSQQELRRGQQAEV